MKGLEGFNYNAIVGRMFRKVDNVVWDLMSGKMGMKTKEGVVTATPTYEAVEGESSKKITDISLSVNPIESFSMPIPAFAQATDLDKVNTGDLVVSGGSNIAGWVLKVNGSSVKVMKADGQVSEFRPPKVEMMNVSGIMVVRDLMNLSGGESGLASLQGSLMPLLMMSGEGGADFDFEKMMPMMLMSQMGGMGGAGGANPMANMMPMIMMMGMLKGGKSPF